MVYFAPLIGAAALASVVAAVPMPQYGSSSSSNGYNNGNQQSQGYSTSTEDSTSTAYNSYSTSTYSSQYSTSTDAATSTSSSSYSAPSYGSGSSYWGGASYDDCVQQCMADYGGGMNSVPNTYTGSTADAGSSGTNGATHTVLVAPTAGVYRYVPFYVNASVGDTVQFVWGSSEHTVTKSSALELCNKSSEAPVFASGEQNQGFIYNQVVNDSNPVFFYCGTPGHCEKGMFGMINANTSTGSGSAASMLPQMMMNSSVLSAMYAYQQNISNGNTMADSWGSNIDMSNMPSWSMQYIAENMLYTRSVLAANPEVMQADGTINMSSAQSFVIPKDLAAQLSAASAAEGAPSSSSASSSTAASTSPSTSTSAHSGAGSITAPRLAAAIAAVAVTVFAL